MLNKNIYVIGAGYVGLANGLMLAQNSKVTFIDKDNSKLEKIDQGISPIEEQELQGALKKFSKNINTSTSIRSLKKSSMAILCLPTNYDENLDSFDTSILESVIKEIHSLNKEIVMVIKSTIPIGFTQRMLQKFPSSTILFSPEFLREGRSFFDVLNPERIIFSPISDASKRAAKLFTNAIKNFNPQNLLFMNTGEAESVKLFANTYLAMRVAYINEIDSFCEENGLDTKYVISGICKDSRIREGYNNPSFGYGGHCFPKDTKQAKSSFRGIPEALFSSIVKSNEKRASFISSRIIDKGIKKIGFYRLTMKSGSDNTRSSSTRNILDLIKNEANEILVYEPLEIGNKVFQADNITVTDDLNYFLDYCDLIVANRVTEELKANIDKVYTRDIFFEN